MSRHNNDTHFSNGLVMGALIGGVAALLLAPKSGKKNREIVKNKFEEAKNTWYDSDGDVKATLNSLFGGAQGSLDEGVLKAKGMFNKVLGESQMKLADLKEKDFDEIIYDVRMRLEGESEYSDDIAYNDDWVEHIKQEWREATTQPKRRSRKN